MRFSWDEAKAASNILKHGVSFAEAETVFLDPLAIHAEDDGREERTVMLGVSEKHRILYVVFEETENDIRIISARKTTPHERRLYEEG